MKRLKIAIALLISALVCIFAVACGEKPETTNQLAAPQNLRIVNNKLIWDSVANAKGYTVSFYGTDHETKNSYYDLYIDSQEDVTFEVCARGDGENYVDSEKTSFTSQVGSAHLTAGLTYTLTTDKTGYAVSGKNVTANGKIVIAEYHEGLPVKEVAKSAFVKTTGGNVTVGGLQATTPIKEVDNESLTSVRLPVTLESIGYEAFLQCVALTEITIPEGVKTIGQGAFHNNTKLKTVTLPSTLEIIKSEAFMGCTKLRTINFPASLKKIEVFAFVGCDSLTKPTLPDSVEVEMLAFGN